MVSTDPTVSLSAMFGQPIGGRDRVPIRHVPKLCGLNINPNDAKGVFQQRLNSVIGQMTGAFGGDVVSTPCAEEMATFDQFVSFLEEPDGEVIVFDTAPTGKSLRELAMPFDWAGFLQRQIQEGKKLAEMMNMSGDSFEELERDKRRYDRALNVLRNRESTVFSLVLVPERLPIEETQSAITFAGADRLMSRWTPAWATAPTSRTCWCAPIVGRRGSAPGCWPPQRSWPDSKGTLRIGLGVAVGNHRARALYERRGYRDSGLGEYEHDVVDTQGNGHGEARKETDIYLALPLESRPYYNEPAAALTRCRCSEGRATR